MAGTASTEDTIISNILNEGGSGNAEDTSVDTTAGTTTGAGEGTSADGKQSGATAGTGTATDKAGKQQAGQQPTDQRQPATTQAPPRSPGDLVDKNGNVLARAGAERRVFEKADKFIRAEYQQQIEHLQTQIATFERAVSAGQQLGLDAQEIATGHQLMAAYKRDPVATIKFLLTQAKSQGHNIEGVGQGVDTEAVRRIIAEHMAPITADREAQTQHAQAVQEINETYTSFIGNYPDAVTHENDIAALLEADPQISPEIAYLKLQSFAYRNQLDWSKPLGPQINARLTAQKTGQGGSQQQLQRGMPTGRTVNGRTAQGTGTVAHESTPTRDIVRQAMLAAGYKIN